MSTRGLVGFYIDGQSRLQYNHSDSYPSGVGQQVLDDLRRRQCFQGRVRKNWLPKLATLVRAIRLVKGDKWYNKLRQTQGDIDAMIEAGHMIDGHTFINDSLFCEWAYVVNLDDKVLEVYRGFQTQPHDRGRYCGTVPENVKKALTPTDLYSDNTYFPCALIGTISLTKRLPKNLTRVAFIKREIQ